MRGHVGITLSKKNTQHSQGRRWVNNFADMKRQPYGTWILFSVPPDCLATHLSFDAGMLWNPCILPVQIAKWDMFFTSWLAIIILCYTYNFTKQSLNMSIMSETTVWLHLWLCEAEICNYHRVRMEFCSHAETSAMNEVSVQLLATAKV